MAARKRPRALHIQDWHVHFIGRDGGTYYMNSFGATERAARKHARENPPLVGIREIISVRALPPRTLRFVDPSARKKVKPAAPPMKPRPIDPDDDFEARFGRDPQRSGNGLSQKLRPSAALARIVGARPLTRGQVMKQLWTYIKYHRLQDKRDGRIIRLDTNLRRVFPSRGRTIEMFQMTRALQRHLQRASPRSGASPRQRARARRKSYSPRRDPEWLNQFPEGSSEREEARLVAEDRLLEEGHKVARYVQTTRGAYTPIGQQAEVNIRRAVGPYGEAALYRMTPPYLNSSWLIISASTVMGEPETYVFRGDPRGKIVSWNELGGSQRGTLDHKKVITDIGYRLVR